MQVRLAAPPAKACIYTPATRVALYSPIGPSLRPMNSLLICAMRGFLIGLSLVFAGIAHAAHPHAGTYQGGYKVYNGSAPTGIPYLIAPIEFTIQDDGVLTNIVNGVTNTSGAIQ